MLNCSKQKLYLNSGGKELVRREKLSETELNESLARLDGWKFSDDQIKTRREFENFAAALEFVNKIGELAETADHHPDISFGWGYAEIALTTHDRGGVTDVDVAFADKVDKLS